MVNDAGNSAASRAADVVGRLADSVEEMEVERMVDGGDAQRMYEELRRPASQQLTLAHAAARPTTRRLRPVLETAAVFASTPTFCALGLGLDASISAVVETDQ